MFILNVFCAAGLMLSMLCSDSGSYTYIQIQL